MPISACETPLPGVLLFEPRAFTDDRGYFIEVYHARAYEEAGLRKPFVQDNLSRSCRDTVRGLHYQLRHPQAKLVMTLRGEILDVVVDIRRGSPTFGQTFAVTLSEANHKQLFVPEGFAHGFCVTGDEAVVLYKCTDLYTPGDEYGVRWSDPALGIDWPTREPLLSPKDRVMRVLNDIPEAELPLYEG